MMCDEEDYRGINQMNHLDYEEDDDEQNQYTDEVYDASDIDFPEHHITELNNPEKNYMRLHDTIRFLESKAEVHPKFYDQHVIYVQAYAHVIHNTQCKKDAIPFLVPLIRQYDMFREFSLDVYLTACRLVLHSVFEYQEEQDLSNMFGSLGMK